MRLLRKVDHTPSTSGAYHKTEFKLDESKHYGMNSRANKLFFFFFFFLKNARAPIAAYALKQNWPHLVILYWFQTSLLLAALPLRRVITACRFMVTDLSSHTALVYHREQSLQSWIEVNCLRSAAVGINLLARRCLPLRHPSAAGGACTI